MHRAMLTLAVAVSTAVAAPVLAQEDAFPRKGAWGGEACFGCAEASLVHFRDPNSAWVWTAAASYTQQRFQSSPSFDDQEGVFNLRLGAGIRFYRPTETRAKPFLGVSGLLGYTGGTSFKGPLFGATAEMGSAYFFTPHLSLGVAGALNLIVQRLSSDDASGTTTQQQSFTASFGGFRLLGAVYF